MLDRVALIFSSLWLAACAASPLAPDPTTNPMGKWTIVAVDGEPTGGGERFWFEIRPAAASARFGCNAGGGSARIDRGWLSPAGNWVITVAGCLPKERMRFERRGFAITAKPMALERRGANALRLRNQVGSIDLVRAT